MIRIPLHELEDALSNPAAYKTRLEKKPERQYKQSYFAALRDAINRYHNDQDNPIAARSYLEGRLDSFKNHTRSQEIVDQLEWYMYEHKSLGWFTFQTRQMVTIPLPDWAKDSLICSGQVSRIDMIPSGGYAVWSLRSRKPEGWRHELRMPLIQSVVAENVLNAPSTDVQVGIYSFSERVIETHCYSEMEIEQAYSRLHELLRQLGY